jgi:hypothetical protein
MEFNSIQKYQKYKNKYLNLKNTNKINNNITYFKQHGSGFFDECRNSGIYMIVGDVELFKTYKSKINPMTNNVIGIRKDMTSCEFFNLFTGCYKLKSDSNTLIQIIYKKQDTANDPGVVATSGAEESKQKPIKPNKLKLKSTYNFKNFIDELSKETITANTSPDDKNKLLLENTFYRNFCNLLQNISITFTNLNTPNLDKYIQYLETQKGPTIKQSFLNFFKGTPTTEKSAADSALQNGSVDLMNLEKMYDYFKDSEINSYEKKPSEFLHYFFVEFSITTSKIISIGGCKKVHPNGSPAPELESSS